MLFVQEFFLVPQKVLFKKIILYFMNRNILIVGALIVVAFAGLMWWGRSAQTSARTEPNASGASSLVASEMLYDFGTISMKDGLASHLFAVKNLTEGDIEIKTINTSCMCTSAYIQSISGENGPFGMVGMGFIPPANEMIRAGESRDVKVVYDPNAHGPAGVGAINRFVYLTESNGETLRLEIRAVVTP